MENINMQMQPMMPPPVAPPVAQSVAQAAPSEHKGWLVIVAMVLVAAGVGGYFLLMGNGFLTSDEGDSIPEPPALPSVSSSDSIGGDSIPKPPALPSGSNGESSALETPALPF